MLVFYRILQVRNQVITWCPIEHPKNDVIIILANRFDRVKVIMILVIALRSLGILGI